MTGIGIGIGLGCGVRGAMSPALLTNRMQALGTVAGGWLADDGVYSGENLVSIPGRVGGTATAGGSATYTRDAIGGRLALNSPSAASRFLTPPLITFKAAIFVATATVPFASFGALVRGRGGRIIVESNSGTSNLRAPSDSWSTYVDGTATAAVTSGTHIFEASGSNACSVQCDLLGLYDGAFPWIGKTGCIWLYADVPTSGQRAEVLAQLKRYYSIP